MTLRTVWFNRSLFYVIFACSPGACVAFVPVSPRTSIKLIDDSKLPPTMSVCVFCGRLVRLPVCIPVRRPATAGENVSACLQLHLWVTVNG